MFLQFWRNFFHRKHFLPTQLTHPMMHAAALEDFPCASQEPFTVPKLSLLLLCAAPETFLAPGLELKNFLASFFRKRLPLFACTGDPHDPSAIHWARDFSSATATVLRCRVQGTSAAPAIHPARARRCFRASIHPARRCCRAAASKRPNRRRRSTHPVQRRRLASVCSSAGATSK